MAGEWWNVEGAKASAEEARRTAAAAACADMVLKKKERKRGKRKRETKEKEGGMNEDHTVGVGGRGEKFLEGDEKVLSFKIRGRS
jgi:hypothetical protein